MSTNVATVLDGLGYSNAHLKAKRTAKRALEITLDPELSLEFLRRMGHDIKLMSYPTAQTKADKLIRDYGGLPALPTNQERENDMATKKKDNPFETPVAKAAAKKPARASRPHGAMTQREQVLALVEASVDGIAPKAIVFATGLPPTTVRSILSTDVKKEGSTIRRISEGVYGGAA